MKSRVLLNFTFFFILSSNIFAGTSTNKTFIMPRPILENLALRYVPWHDQIKKSNDSDHGSTLQFSAFYQHSTEKNKLGKYFGYFAPGEGSFRDYIEVVNVQRFSEVGDNIWASYIVHDKQRNTENLAGKLKFKPKQEIYGAQLDYHQRMDLLSDKLFIEISIPVAKVKNDINISPEGDLKPISLVTPTGSISHQFVGKTLLDYFKGQIFDLNKLSETQQEALSFAKIDGSQSRTGIADVAATVGYRLITNQNYAISLKGYCTIPTGNRATGEYLFEPICGNGGHWVLGFGPDAELNVWKDGDSSFGLFSSLKVSYGLEGSERRTLGLKKDAGSSVPFSQYYLVGKKGTIPLLPFANISTLDLKIEPKWQFEALIDLAFSLSCFHINLGYNFFVKEKEGVSLKKSWPNDTFAIAVKNYDTKPDVAPVGRERSNYHPFLYVFTNPSQDPNIINHTIEEKNLDILSAATSSQSSHKLHASLGYLSGGENSFLFSLWGAYEFSDSNSALSNYSLGTNFSFVF